jgi:hypothetical protein
MVEIYTYYTPIPRMEILYVFNVWIEHNEDWIGNHDWKW